MLTYVSILDSCAIVFLDSSPFCAGLALGVFGLFVDEGRDGVEEGDPFGGVYGAVSVWRDS